MKGALEQLTAISMDKESNREQLAFLLFDNACILKQTRILRGFMFKSNLIWVRLDSPSRLIGPSTREYLQASNIFVWYIANGFVCWLS